MNLNPSKVLSIDWDFVTGDCSSTTSSSIHSHCGFCRIVKTYGCRGSRHFLDVVWKEKQDRLLKLRLHKSTPIFVAECHANIMDIIEYFDEPPSVFDFDTHYDKYDNASFLHCGNWIYHLELLGGSVVSRPKSIDTVGAIFICKSSPWTPRCMDKEFFRFINRIVKKTQTEPNFIGHRKRSLKNGYKKTND
jgi:hypothetical protein